MFTGIVAETGRVTSVESAEGSRHLRLAAGKVLDGIEVGDSIAVNGACLTVTTHGADHVDVSAVAETLARTNLGVLEVGDEVNLERPMRADGRFDGHIVQGHIDGVATILSITPEGDSSRVRLRVNSDLRRYLVQKGSVALDGVSLTLTAAEANEIEVVLIPHTLDVTTWGHRRVEDRVNLEVDIVAKYLERLMEARS